MVSTVLQIDFGDGNGWITFDPTVVTNYYVDYSSGGEKLIQTLLYNDFTRLYSMSRIIVGPRGHFGITYELIEVPGLNVGLFDNGCKGDNIQSKVVIYLEGFDMLDFIPSKNRSVSEIYADMISDKAIVQLKNEGYDFVVVDWKNSRIDIRFNALYFVNLLEHLKCIYTELGNNQQFVIMGESMGGLVARYALTYMETEYYFNHNTSPFFVDEQDVNNTDYLYNHPEIYSLPVWCQGAPDKMHNTRLLITLDTPHQGANIPMAIQYAYRQAMAVFGGFINPLMMQSVMAANLFLDAQAAQQMLIYHIDTKYGTPPYFNYESRTEKDVFFAQLYSLGNYPQFAKVMAMSNGSLHGVNQYNYLTNTSRTANDRLLEFDCDLYIRVLGQKVPLFHGDMGAYTNPNGQGSILSASSGGYRLKLKVKWFKIKITWTYTPILSLSEGADLLPYCTSAGGWAGSDNFDSNFGPNNSTNISNSWWLNFFHASHTVNNGCITYDTHLGLNGFLSSNFDYSLCSDGFNFGFVPVQSALDYNYLGNNPLDMDLGNGSGIQLAARLADVRASVIVGYDGDDTYLTANHNHVGFRNDIVNNINRSGNSVYVSCINVDNNVVRGFLNAEIGDEELYLENCTLPWTADYQALFDIHVNERSPYYEYVSQPNYPGSDIVSGVYSKEDDYIIIGSGTANFYYDSGNSPTGIGLSIASGPGGTYYPYDQDQKICECEDYTGNRMADKTDVVPPAAETITAYPNPNDGNLITVAYDFQKDLPVQVIITSAYGAVVFKTTAAAGNNTLPVNIAPLNLSNGLYAVTLSNGTETKTTKLLINK